jgi:hypothetical protein
MENTMRLEKHQESSDKIIPVIAALPYRVQYDRDETEQALADVPTYDPSQQRTLYEARDYSTSREEDSAGGGIIQRTKNDTKKDD